MEKEQSSEHRTAGLIIKHLQGDLSREETLQLEEWITRAPEHKVLFDELMNEETRRLELKELDGLTQRIETKIYAALPAATRTIPLYKRPLVRMLAAASVVGLLLVGGYFLMKTTDDGPQTIVQDVQRDVKAPDKNRAQITLADGSVVYLDSVGNGQLANMNGVIVRKTEDGRIEYSRQSSVDSRQLIYNTLSNPRGSKVIDMTLADGSRVWLNAGSSITYPVAFISNERKVTITGEAYFEVAHNVSKPFIVSKGDMNITVLGTRFNVNAYDDESEMRVTLLEGSVNVSTMYDVRGTKIKPGEQAISTGNGQLTISKDVDVEQVMAWKNGRFQFDDASIEEVMRHLARWYDVEIVYQRKVTEKFGGTMPRNVNISKMLQFLELTGEVRFTIEGRKIIVR